MDSSAQTRVSARYDVAQPRLPRTPTPISLSCQSGQRLRIDLKFSVDWTVQLWVFGLAAVIPSTLKELQKVRQYSLDVALSTAVPSGRVETVIAKHACTDATGNPLQRTNQSLAVIRFNNDPTLRTACFHALLIICFLGLLCPLGNYARCDLDLCKVGRSLTLNTTELDLRCSLGTDLEMLSTSSTEKK